MKFRTCILKLHLSTNGVETITQNSLNGRHHLSVDVVASPSGLLALQKDYERLQALTRNTLPFAMFDWHLTWCEHFLHTEGRVRTEPRFHVVREGDGTCVAIIPFIATHRRCGPLELVSLDMLGADPALTEIRGMLLAPGLEAAVAQVVLQSLAGQKDVNWIQWSGISAAFGAALARHVALEPLPAQLDFVLPLGPSWTEFRASLKRNIRESIRHCYNSLKRDGHEFRIDIAQQPADVEPALQRFFELHAQRAALEGTIMHHNHFARQSARRFLIDVCVRLAKSGVVRIFEMRVGEKLVATRIGFQIEDCLYTYYSGFDPEWRKYSVMTTTVTEMIKYAIEQGLKRVNLSPTKDIAKTRWGPETLEITQAVQVSHSTLSRLAWAGYRRAKSAGRLPNLLRRLSSSARKEWT